jgi:exodeoxyribonuclease VII large subunit
MVPVPLRVGLITSLGSDAYNDVLRTLQESGFAFRVTAHGARVQGRSTEPSVLNALDWFRERAADFDVILVCRGGGSRTDLAWFDSVQLGRAVALFPLPVVVGIGHEQDFSVLDAVGWRAKTPTAAASLLVDAVARSLDDLELRGSAVLDVATRRTARSRGRGPAPRRASPIARPACAPTDRARLRARRLPRATPRARRPAPRHRARLRDPARCGRPRRHRPRAGPRRQCAASGIATRYAAPALGGELMAKPKGTASDPGYGAAAARLEEILARIEEGQVDIDELSGLVGEAAALVSLCREKIRSAEIQVKTITEQLERESAEAGPAADGEPA